MNFKIITIYIQRLSLIIGLIILSATAMVGQTEIKIDSDRPDQSDGVHIVPKNMFQIESGLLFSKNAILNNLMVRYGITKSTEFRLLLDLGESDGNIGLLPLGISIKQKIVEQTGIVPTITVIGYLYFSQITSKAFRRDKLIPTLTLAFQNDLSDRLSVGYNVGSSTLSKDINLSTSLGIALTSRLSGFIEYFSHFENSLHPEHNIDIGLLYLINNKTQLDIALGRSLFFDDNRAFITVGLSHIIGL